MKTNKIVAYTDGGCRGNPGLGGWGAYIKVPEKEFCLHGSVSYATNNQMELTAAIEALKSFPEKCSIEIITDSQYVKNGITQWVDGWKKKNWKTASKKPVKNKELWIELDDLCQLHDVKWSWVRGHCGDYGNEKADELANYAMDNHNEN